MYLLSAAPDRITAVIIIAAAFGIGLAGGLFSYFKLNKRK